METQSQSEQPKEEPTTEDEAQSEEAALRQAQDTAEAEAALKAEGEAAFNETPVLTAKVENDDDAPLTLTESVESVKQIGRTAKDGLLRPWYRFARRTVRSAQTATEAFFEGVLNDKKDKK